MDVQFFTLQVVAMPVSEDIVPVECATDLLHADRGTLDPAGTNDFSQRFLRCAFCLAGIRLGLLVRARCISTGSLTVIAVGG